MLDVFNMGLTALSYLDIPQETIIGWFEAKDAYWVHDGSPESPHAVLHSEKHSNGFIDCLKVLQYPRVSECLASQLVGKILRELDGKIPDCVIGSPMAGITFAYDVARALGTKRYLFVEKDPNDKDKKVFSRFQISAEETVLDVEELITTAKTVRAVRAAVEEGNEKPVNWLNIVGALVYRPDDLSIREVDGRKIIAVIEKKIWAIDPKVTECPLCQQGSEAIKNPKMNWARLTGKS